MKILISWEDYQYTCNRLAAKLQDHATPTTLIVPVPRGGLVAASIIAYKLGLGKRSITLINESMLRNILVIDDICDTGRTFAVLRRQFPNATFVAPYVKPDGSHFCSHWGKGLSQDDWAVFPYAPDDEVNR